MKWIEFRTPLKLEISWRDSDLPLSWKVFKNNLSGLNGIKELVRKSGIVPANTYNAVFFVYEDKPPAEHIATAWTYPNPLYSKEPFVEVPVIEGIDVWEENALPHELMHAFYRILWFQGIAVKDDIDLYDKNDQPYALDGNYARNLKRLEPYWDRVAFTPPAISIMLTMIEALKQVVSLLGKLVSGRPTIENFAQAIKQYEGWYPGSRSFRNNNPGNLKFARQLGAIGKDEQGFAIFENYNYGWNALCMLLQRAVKGQSDIYNPNMNFFDFFRVYAPASDNNAPDTYALFVARKLGVNPNAKIKELAK